MMWKVTLIAGITLSLAAGMLSTYANPATMHSVIDQDKNLVSDKYFYPSVSFRGVTYQKWTSPDGPCPVENGVYTVKVASGKNSRMVAFTFDCSTILARELEIQIDYSLQGAGTMTVNGKTFQLRPGQNKKLAVTVPVESTFTGGSVRLTCNGADSELKFSNLVVKPLRYAPAQGKPLLLDGKIVDKICYIKTSVKDTAFDQRAANLMQKNLYFAGGGMLPIVEINATDKAKNAIIVGQAAKKHFSGKTIKKVGEGGYALGISAGIAAIYGRHPSGTPAAVFAFLRKLGFFYLTHDEYVVPTAIRLELAAMQEVSNPAIPMRVDGWPSGDSMGLGMSDPYYMVDMMVTSQKSSGHSIPRIIPWAEFKDTHPEFFAMQEDGLRRPGRPPSDDIHYCFSNKKFQQVLTGRVKEFLRADPLGEYMGIFPGDGMNYHCRCPECREMGGPTDRMLYLVNIVARAIRDEFPDVKLTTYSYTDTRNPPEKYKPEKNVIVKICPYGPIWNNHLITYHEDNKLGLEALQGWLKTCPENLGAFVYPSSCAERLNLWPSFYANYDKFKLFGEHGFKSLEYCGLGYYGLGSTVPPSNIFNPAHRYILTKMLWSPDLDFEKELDTFFTLYYGAGAPWLRDFFNLIHREVKEKNWSRNTEQILRGFVTQELANKGLAMFAQAQAAVGKQQPFKDRVMREKIYLLWSYLSDINRANGKLKPDDFPTYAACLSEFCQLAKQFNFTNLGRFTFDKWFWDNAMIKIPENGRWYDAPIIDKLIKDPEKTLGANIPRMQVKTDYGFMIPAQGMFGGEAAQTCWLRSDIVPAKILRRPSSGYGMAQMLLTLDKAPDKAITIKVNGIDNEKEGIAQMELLVNGQKIHSGNAPWQKQEWSVAEFTAAPEMWQKGDNTIQFLNTTPDIEEFTQGRASQQNYYWGWYIIDACHFHLK